MHVAHLLNSSALLLAALLILTGTASAQSDFVTFETGPVRPLATSADGSELYATNIPDGRLEIFDVTAAGLVKTGSVQVGLEPCAVAVASDGRVWVVNHLSDSVSIVDVSLSPPLVVQTLIVGDEPRDIVFGGDLTDRAFITTAHRGQHRLTISGAIGGGDPQLTTPSIGRADVWVFDATNPGSSIGGDPVRIMTFFTDTPRALTVSNDGATVYVAGFHTGNQTTAIQELFICDHFDPTSGCTIQGLPSPTGMEGPSATVGPPSVAAPFTGIIAKFDNAQNRWENGAGTNLNTLVPFRLPDHDVFAFSADDLHLGAITEFDHVGTILFNMAVNPSNGKIFVSNTESPNHIPFEGPGGGGSTVQGHLSESRISVLSGSGTVDVRHLNNHIDYSKLHTDNPDEVDTTAKNHSLATPLEMVFSGDGSMLYVAAFGSAKVGVFITSEIENDSFAPETDSANYIATGGGPSGLTLDESLNRLYIMTRFDNSLAVVDLSDNSTLQTVALHNPEPPEVVIGRPFLYDAFNTSSNGEASCASCHIFGDNDNLGWNLGNPDDVVTNNNQPGVPNTTTQSTFHPMKGPMTTQTLRGLSTHGAMHWRGDRLHGEEGEDMCGELVEAPCSENHSFMNFRVAFEGLVGKQGILSQSDMQKFTDFALQIQLPPNPVRNLDNTLTTAQDNGLTHYLAPNTDGGNSCEDCHRLNRATGFFGTGGRQSFEGETQNFKVPHLRNMYTKVGMFGILVDPDTLTLGPQMGDQVRGFGVLHDGSIDTLEHFVSVQLFSLNQTQETEVEQFMLAFDTDLAPMVGQQVTLDSGNSAQVGGRITQMIDAAKASFVSPAIGTDLKECDLVVKGSVGGIARGWVYQPASDDFQDDTGGTIADGPLQTLAGTEGPLTYTCVPPGSGDRMGINRDRDTLLDGNDNCPDADNDSQTDTDGDLAGDACDQDDDGDTLLDVYETNTGTYASIYDTGTNPLLSDTDGDGFSDDEEIAAGTNPVDSNSFPTEAVKDIPALPFWGIAALGAAFLAAAAGAVQRRGTA